jgi:hypothetical protein
MITESGKGNVIQIDPNINEEVVDGIQALGSYRR